MVFNMFKLYVLLVSGRFSPKKSILEHLTSRAKVAFLADDFQEGLRAHSGLELSMLPQFLGAEPVPGGRMSSDGHWFQMGIYPAW